MLHRSTSLHGLGVRIRAYTRSHGSLSQVLRLELGNVDSFLSSIQLAMRSLWHLTRMAFGWFVMHQTVYEMSWRLFCNIYLLAACAKHPPYRHKSEWFLWLHDWTSRWLFALGYGWQQPWLQAVVPCHFCLLCWLFYCDVFGKILFNFPIVLNVFL